MCKNPYFFTFLGVFSLFFQKKLKNLYLFEKKFANIKNKPLLCTHNQKNGFVAQLNRASHYG